MEGLTMVRKKIGKREKLDQLIDWYERFKPAAGQRIETVASPVELAKILKYEVSETTQAPQEQRYRSRVIVAVASEPRRRKGAIANQVSL
jgi:hypothetical protein